MTKRRAQPSAGTGTAVAVKKEEPKDWGFTTSDDEVIDGFYFGWAACKGKTPYDYMTDPETGKRPGVTTEPSGATKTDMTEGLKDYHCIPSCVVWESGKWFSEMSAANRKALESVVRNKEEQFNAWCVNANGSPGNFIIRVFILPDKASHFEEPDHPMFWDDEVLANGDGEKKPWALGGGGSSVTTYTGPAASRAPATPAKPAAAPVQKAPPLPFGIRFRCALCGHWFKESDLVAHNSHCCPGKEESRDSDWAIICECCDTLDEVGSCKEGFPRPKPVAAKPKVAKKEEVKPGAEAAAS